MKQTTNNERTGIQWSLTEHLEDLDFADDIALLSHTHQQMQDKSQLLETIVAENKRTKNQNHADQQQ